MIIINRKPFKMFSLISILALSFGLLSAQPQNVLQLEKKTREIFEMLATGKYKEVTQTFDHRLKEGLSAQKLEKSWLELVRQVGPYKGIEQVKSEPYVGSTIVICTGRFGDLLVDLKCRFNGAGEISSLYFFPHDYVPPSPPEDTIRRE